MAPNLFRPFRSKLSVGSRLRPYGNYWDVYSPKAGRTLRLRRDLDYYFLVLLESSPAVVTVEPTPLKVHVHSSGGAVVSTIDWRYSLRDGSEIFCSARYRIELQETVPVSRVAKAIAAEMAWAQQTGSCYCVATEATILANVQLLSNWIYILSFLDAAGGHDDADLGERVVRAVRANRQMTLRDLKQAFHDESADAVVSATLRQLHRGNLSANLAKSRLTGDTPFCSAP